MGGGSSSNRVQGVHLIIGRNNSQQPAIVARDRTITYAELCRDANRVARCLDKILSSAKLSNQKNLFIGTLLSPSYERIVIWLAILKCGATYVPLPVGYPIERIQLMLEDSDAAMLIGEEPYLSQKVQNFSKKTITLQDLWFQSEQVTSTSFKDRYNPILTILYTSGTTGKPKAVKVKHQGIVRLISDAYCGGKAGDRWIALSNAGFDAALFETWIPLMRSHLLVVFPHEEISATVLAKTVELQKISVVFTTTGLFNVLVDNCINCFKGVRTWMFGGEAGSVSHILKALDYLSPGVTLVNLYGPTECSVVAARAEMLSNKHLMKELNAVPIGTAVPQTSLYILDEELKKVPEGSEGELYIAGSGVADGYWRRPGITAERFLDDPFDAGKKMYKTGDIVKMYKDQLVFVGRKDGQIKLRGFRIELGDIETALLEYPKVQQAAVICHQKEMKEKFLCGYVVPKKSRESESSELTEVELKQFLETKLPPPMIPSQFVFMEQLPLNHNNKVDRKQLVPPSKLTRKSISSSSFVKIAPKTDIQKKVAEIWGQILDIPNWQYLSLEDNFFQLGGHSLLSNRLAAQLETEFGVQIPLSTVFNHANKLEKLCDIVTEYTTQPNKSVVITKRSNPSDSNNVLSSTQKRLWVLFQKNPTGVAYNIPLVYDIEGEISVKSLQQAMIYLQQKHEVLRTVIRPHSTTSVPVAMVMPVPKYFPIPVINLESEKDAVKSVKGLMEEDTRTPFDLTRGPVMRVKLFQLSKNSSKLLIVIHHIAFDGTSVQVFNKDLMNFYEAAEKNYEPPDFSALIQYSDFAYWESMNTSPEMIADQAEFWKKVLVAPIPHLELATDFPGSKDHTAQLGGRVKIQLKASLTQKIRDIASTHECTNFMIFLLAWQLFLHKYTHQDDILIGTFLANRKFKQIQNMVGFFINPVVIRTAIGSNPKALELLMSVRKAVLGAMENTDIPYDSVVQIVNPDRESQNPLFRTALVFQNMDLQKSILDSQRLKITMEEINHVDNGSTKFDLMLELYDMPEREVWGWIEYRSDLWRHESVERMAVHFEAIVDQLPDLLLHSKKVSEIDILTKAEKELILKTWHQHPHIATPEQIGCVHKRFERAAEQFPDRIALKFEKEEMTYRELNSRANRIANYLRKNGVSAGKLVVVYMARDINLMPAILGVLKAGGAYVPVDPIYPASRILYILKDTQAAAIVTSSTIVAELESHKEFPRNIFMLDIEQKDTMDEVNKEDDKNLETEVCTPNDLVYIIYTSGSTGNPKGVMLRHYNVVRLFDELNVHCEWNENDAWALFHSFAFDVSVHEMWGALFYGGKLVVLSKSLCQNTEELHKVLEAEKVTNLNQTPSAFQILTQVDEMVAATENRATLPHLRFVFLAGEMLHFETLRSFVQRRGDKKPTIVNLYGITETTVHVTWRPITWEDIESNSGSNIGYPIADLDVFILDPYMKPVPIGVVGEMYVGGPGVAKGYLNLTEMTTERFLLLPQYGYSGEEFFRSGDLAKYLPDGQMIYVGRKDHQVKVRGFRIDLNDVTAAIMKTGLATKAHTMLFQRDSTTSNSSQLTSYLVAPELMAGNGSDSYVTIDRRDKSSKAKATVNDLVENLQQLLPYYMLPNVFILLDDFTLNNNGKIDASTLPKDLVAGDKSRAPSAEKRDNKKAAASLTDTEQDVMKIWKDVLNNQEISASNNFFAVGGNSLLATSVILKVKKTFNVNLPVSTIFTKPDLRALAAEVDKAKTQKGTIVDYPIWDIDKEAEMEPLTIPTAVSDSGDILLTGATGFVGCFLLLELLKKTQANIHCVVKADNVEHGLQRIINTMKSYDVDVNPVPKHRIFAVPGDLSVLKFGMKQNEYDALASKVKSIYHSAAKVTFVEPYHNLKASNVDGTKNVVRFACHIKQKHLHHMSSVSVFGSLRTMDGITSAKEDMDPTTAANKCYMGYADSKVVSEKVVWSIHAKGLPVTVYRLGGVFGHTVSGAANRTDILARALAGCLAVGCYPRGMKTEELIAVDEAASLVYDLSLKTPKNIGKAFHIWNGSLMTLEQLYLLVAKARKIPEKSVTVPEWIDMVTKQGEKNQFTPLLSIVTEKLSVKQLSVWELNSICPFFEMDNVRAFLPDRKLTPINQDLVNKYVNFLVKEKIF